MTAFAALLFLVAGITSCATRYVDPNAGAETIYLRTLDHAQQFDVEFIRTPEEGPLRQVSNAWTVLWFVPLNHPDMGLWLAENLDEEMEAANVRAAIRTPWYGHLLFFPSLGLLRVDRVEFEMQPVRLTWLSREEGEPVAPLRIRQRQREEPPLEAESVE